MIRKFRHRGLERFFSKGANTGIQPTHANRLRLILGRLNASTPQRLNASTPQRLNALTGPNDMNLPRLNLHALKSRQSGRWSVRVSGNWRVTFRFDGPDATDVDYEDYH